MATSFEGMDLSLVVLAVASYVGIWVYNVDLVKGGELLPTLRLPFVLCFAVGIGSGILTAAAVGRSEVWIEGTIGAAVLIVSMILHHHSLAIATWGIALAAALLRVDAPPSFFFFVVVLFVTSYAVSNKGFVELFGTGAVLFSLVVAFMLLIIQLIGPTRTSIAFIMSFCILVNLLLTGVSAKPHPLYHQLMTLLAAAAAAAIGMEVTNLTIHVPVLTAILSVGLAFLVWYFTRHPGILGPFYSFEMRAAGLCGVSVMSTLVTAASMETNEAQPPLSFTLFCIVSGYCTALVVVAIIVILVQILEPTSPHSHQLFWLDTAMMLGYLFLPGMILALTSPLGSAFLNRVIAGYGTIGEVLGPVLDASQRVFGLIDPSWHYAAVSSLMVSVAFVLYRQLLSSHLVLAPLFSNTVGAASPRTNNVALTFNGALDSEATPKLLKLLKDAELKSTFFVDGKSVRENPELVRQVAEAGHEVGALGFAGPAWTTEVLADITRTRDLVHAATRKPVSWYRPADGSSDIRVVRGANRVGLRAALWSICTWDWNFQDKDDMISELKDQGTGAGDVILLHHTIPEHLKPSLQKLAASHDVVELTAQVVRYLETKGLTSVTMSDLHPIDGDVEA